MLVVAKIKIMHDFVFLIKLLWKVLNISKF